VATAAERDAAMRFGTHLACASVSAVALLLAVRRYTRPRTTVIKLQVLLVLIFAVFIFFPIRDHYLVHQS
jgi:hypothetical protein